MEQGYYWAYRKGNPVPEIVYVYQGCAWEIYIREDGTPELDWEHLSEQKWILGEKVTYE